MNQQMNTILFSAICACFGLQSSSAAAAVLIREAYQEPENAPRPGSCWWLHSDLHRRNNTEDAGPGL